VEPSIRGEKIYEYDLDVTGVTDYGIRLRAILAGRERSHRKARASISRLEDMRRAASQGECAAWTTS
jgi:hypothetical protein